MVSVGRLPGACLLVLVVLCVAPAWAGAAAPGAAAAGASPAVRVATGTQAQALRIGGLRVRVRAPRAMRLRLTASVRRARRWVRIARPRIVRLRSRRTRTVSLRLTRGGRRLLAACVARRVTVMARETRRRGTRARRNRSLLLDSRRCRARQGSRALPGCAEAESRGGRWPFYSGTLDGSREQVAEKSLTVDNVSRLGTAWKTTMPDGGVIHSTPVVTDGCVYTGTDLGNVYALNADTGRIVWTQALGEGSRGSNTFQGAGIVGSPAVAGGLVYVGATTPDASVLSALDQATGQVVWKRVVDADPGGGLDSSPVPFEGMVFQAFKGDESSNHSHPGFVIVDGSRGGNGQILVKTHNIPPEDFAAGYRGGSTINTPAVDLEKNLVFAGTGNPASQKQHPITNSLLKIDANPDSPTFGRILASHRGTSDSYPSPRDVDSPACQTELQWPLGRYSCAQFDFNFLASPNLWKSSGGRQMLGALQKSGVYTAVYTDTMERAWQTVIALPCFACNLSSTAAGDHGIYVAVSGGNLYSLDPDTGAVQWATPLTGTFRYNGLAFANGVVYSLNDAVGALQAFDAYSGAPLLTHPFMQDNQSYMHDMGNSSGVSVARHTVFATAQSNGTSTLFALRLGAGGAGGDGGEEPPSEQPPPSGEEPPSDDGDESGSGGLIVTGPGATSYGYLTPVVVISKGGRASYTNADAPRHNVASTDGLFRSELAATGETKPVVGTERLEAGSYQFFCEPHPNMRGTLVVR